MKRRSMRMLMQLLTPSPMMSATEELGMTEAPLTPGEVPLTPGAGGELIGEEGELEGELEGEEFEEDETDAIVVIFVFVGLLIGVLTRYTKSRLKHGIPYTVMLLAIGFIISALAYAIDKENLGLIGESLTAIANINGEVFLLIFIPALIFESAFSVNFHIFMRVLGQSLVLAGPGVVLNAVFTAILVFFLIPYGWTFQFALFFGAIVSATDPVAVVALLKDLGASKRLATLIEGESLLNDGSAFVMFEILRQSITEGGIGAGEVVGLTFQLSLGGAVFGILVGLFISYWLSKVFNDSLVETSLTIVAAYLAFFIAEDTDLRVSGILTVVFLGITLARFQAVISPKSAHGLHQVWHQLEYMANTLIFLASGIIVADAIIGTGRLGAADFGYLIAIYIFIHITRFLTLAILYYPMKKLGYGIDWKEATLLWFGALRGAIGLALALITEEEETIPQIDRDRVLFHVAGIVFLTLLINGQLTKYVLLGLKIDQGKPHSNLLIRNALEHLHKKSQGLVKILRSNYHFSGAKFNEIEQELPDYMNLITLKEDFSKEGDSIKADTADIRHRVIASMKSFYWKQYNEGMTSRQALEILADAADEGLDADDLFVQWESIKRNTRVPDFLKRMYQMRFLRPLTNRVLFASLSISVELVTAVIFASDRMGRIVEAFPEWGDLPQVETVQKEIKEVEKLARKEWDHIRMSYPEVTQAIQTKHASIFILNKDTININHLLSDGIVSSDECSKMISAIDAIREKHQKLYFALPNDREVFRDLAFMKQFSPAERDSFQARTKMEFFKNGETLYTRGDDGGNFWVVIQGLVEVQFDVDHVATVGPGYVVGAWSAMSQQKSAATCVALTPVEAMKFDQNLLAQIRLNKNAEIELWKLAAISICQGKFASTFPGDSFSIGELCTTSSFLSLHGLRALPANAFILAGQATRMSNAEVIQAPSVIVIDETRVNDRPPPISEKEINENEEDQWSNFQLLLPGEAFRFENAKILLFDGAESLDDSDAQSEGGGIKRALTSTNALGLLYSGGRLNTSLPGRMATMTVGKRGNIPEQILTTSLLHRTKTGIQGGVSPQQFQSRVFGQPNSVWTRVPPEPNAYERQQILNGTGGPPRSPNQFEARQRQGVPQSAKPGPQAFAQNAAPQRFNTPPPQSQRGTPPPQSQRGTPPPQSQRGTPPPYAQRGMSPPPQSQRGTPEPLRAQSPSAYGNQSGRNTPSTISSVGSGAPLLPRTSSLSRVSQPNGQQQNQSRPISRTSSGRRTPLLQQQQQQRGVGVGRQSLNDSRSNSMPRSEYAPSNASTAYNTDNRLPPFPPGKGPLPLSALGGRPPSLPRNIARYQNSEVV